MGQWEQWAIGINNVHLTDDHVENSVLTFMGEKQQDLLCDQNEMVQIQDVGSKENNFFSFFVIANVFFCLLSLFCERPLQIPAGLKIKK